MSLARPSAVANSFIAGQELVRWDLELLDATAVRLTMVHALGTIVEYFSDTQAALARERELEALLMGARGFTLSPKKGAATP
jgi:hypothetical protein